MYSNPVPPALHRPTNDHGTPRPMPGVRRESKSKNEGSDSEAGVLCGPVGSLFDTPCPREDSHPPNALVESADWEAISAWIPGVINPSPQEVTEGMGVSDAVFNTYPPYSVDPILASSSRFSHHTLGSVLWSRLAPYHRRTRIPDHGSIHVSLFSWADDQHWGR